ncbi:MAG: CYTH domain-containing protein [Bacillota bacterium]|nr:MAG: hypothetical protein DIU70_03715 [Bacillota bacterium]
MELEIKLTAMPEAPVDPVEILVQLAGLPDLEDRYLLGAATPVTIRDLYYDTPDRRLRQARVGMRVRIQDGQPWITVKRSVHRDGGLARREEFEQRLDRESLGRAVALLREYGLLSPEARPMVDALLAGEPTGGLEPVLLTETRRVSRPVLRLPGRLPVATLALDRVVYKNVRGEPVFHDVEVEALAGTGEEVLRELESLLVQAAGGYLKPAGESKLARGLRLLGEI